MTGTTVERNMRRILLIFAVICFLLAGFLFIQARELGQQLEALTAEARPVEQNPHIVRKQLRRTRLLVWASLGGGVLLIVSAAAAGRKKHTTTSESAIDA